MDAMVAPADIKYPTSLELLNKSCGRLESAIVIRWEEVPHTGHKLPVFCQENPEDPCWVQSKVH